MGPGYVGCEYYHYIDRDGNRHYVDDSGEIPPEYSQNLKVYKDRYDHLSDEEKERLQTQERLQEQINRTRLQQSLEREKERERAERQRKAQAERETFEKNLETDITIKGNRVLVPVQLGSGGQEIDALLLLDTGASITVLHHAAVEQLNLQSQQRYKAKVADGSLIPAYRVELAYLQVGPIRMSQAKAMVIKHEGPPVSHDGLLGMNFLRQLDYTIDFKNKKIKWRP